jgi:hypothetical protein
MDTSAIQLQNPETEYQRRLDSAKAEHAQLAVQDERLSYARFALMFLGAALAIWLVLSKTHSYYWLLIPVVLFVICAVVHARVVGWLESSRRAMVFYERGLARLRNQWMGKGQFGERFLDSAHPYARDLDLFGPGSIFEMICTARTRAGEETLAKWLLAPAPPDEIATRQSAVTEMRGRLKFREDLAVLSTGIDAGVRPDLLVRWAEGTQSFESGRLRVVLQVLGYAWRIAAVATVIRWQLWPALALLTLVNLALTSWLWTRAQESIEAIEAATHDLALLASVMARLESEPFSAPKLVALQARLGRESKKASQVIARLTRLVDRLAERRNLYVTAFDRFVFRSMICTLQIEAWRKQFGPQIRSWLEALGEIEALSDLAGYSYEHPADVFAEFTPDAPCFEAEGLAHPLMPEGTAVKNDLTLDETMRLVIISGPNMAGKSTFVRAVGVNAVLAQCGAPVRAKKLRISPLAVAASVCVLDSLQGGVSRFYAEITRLKLIMDMAQQPTPVLFLLDELLSGTNSHDRRIGAEAVVRGLFQRNAIGLLTTHDLALAEIAAALGSRATNAHFRDRLDGAELHFDYRLTPGIVQTSNALALMRSIGLDV